jgi:hypothetical protein
MAAKKGQKGLLHLPQLALHAAILGEMGNQYTEWYLNKGEYRETPESGIQWVMRCFGRPRYFYKMFWMIPKVFMKLHDLLILNYGLTSSNNVSSIESLSMWTVHTKFYKVLNCLCKLAKENIKPTDLVSMTR